MEIRAVIFDYGNVLSRDQDIETFDLMAELIAVSTDDLRAAFWHHRNDYDRGVTGGAEFWAGVARTTGVDISAEQRDLLITLDALCWSHLDPRMLRWARAIARSGRRVGICSNMPSEISNELFDNRLLQPSPGIPRFDPVVSSCHIGSIKPEPAIYLHTLELLGLPAQQVLFLDDRDDNVDGARAVGMQAIQVRSGGLSAEQIAGIDPLLPVDGLRSLETTRSN